MIDITHKVNTLRQATAEATVSVSKPETITALENRTVPKGDVFEMAKTAGLFGVKKTAEMIPDCHPLPVEYTGVEYSINGLDVTISMTVKTIYKTGVEVEAMHGVSVVALTMYDMLKPIDKGIEIKNIKLIRKKGGKSDYKDKFSETIDAHLIVCNDLVHAGKKEDKAGQIVVSKLEGLDISVSQYSIIPQAADAIENALKASNARLIIFTGGTGLGTNDILRETLTPLFDKHIPGMEEAMRNYGQNRTPFAMISRSVAGSVGQNLVLGIPGSSNGAKESMDALFPAALHALKALAQKH